MHAGKYFMQIANNIIFKDLDVTTFLEKIPYSSDMLNHFSKSCFGLENPSSIYPCFGLKNPSSIYP